MHFDCIKNNYGHSAARICGDGGHGVLHTRIIFNYIALFYLCCARLGIHGLYRLVLVYLPVRNENDSHFHGAGQLYLL